MDSIRLIRPLKWTLVPYPLAVLWEGRIGDNPDPIGFLISGGSPGDHQALVSLMDQVTELLGAPDPELLEDSSETWTGPIPGYNLELREGWDATARELLRVVIRDAHVDHRGKALYFGAAMPLEWITDKPTLAAWGVLLATVAERTGAPAALADQVREAIVDLCD